MASRPRGAGAARRTVPRDPRPAGPEHARQAATRPEAPTALPVRDPQAALRAAVAAGEVPERLSRFNLPPAPPIVPRDVQVDLGSIDATYAGRIVVVDGGLDIGTTQRLEDTMADEARGRVDRAAAMRAFCDLALLGWNLTKMDRAGRVRALPQPEECGLDDLPLRDFPVIVVAIQQQLRPDPKSLPALTTP